ncbi:MAG TPA: S-adenosylmethionine:tRNA ribosyltransferase-isomerase [Thermoanaerobaculia bacterium]|jgi:S-adenosylmethionine:tRNA ribosyltransferase-isomerase|nr:S-adenosylmethionine:tRNA ribosyltransferase-isomerase [Thermoanaerobaculia bacterium]
MKKAELVFDRPQALQAAGPPEYRGLERDEVRLLVTTDRGHEHARFRDLPRFLTPGTLLVVNTSATLPASLPAWHAGLGPFLANVSTSYGNGLYLVEPRTSAAEPGPLPLEVGDPLEIAGLPARLVAPHPGLPRLWFLHVEGDLRPAMEQVGSPIRYGYLEPPYPPIDAYQTFFSQIPGSAEMPSAGRPFTARVVDALRSKGIELAPLALHTGVSSHELEADEVEEQVLYAEPFEVTRRTADAVTAARREGRPVIAVGTTVVRALESAWDGERVREAAGFTRLLIHPGRPVKSVNGLITGLHDPLASHLALLYAVVPSELVRKGYAEAVREGYLWHEFGDSHLLLSRTA